MIKNGETATVEFKIATPRELEVAQRLCGLANLPSGGFFMPVGWGAFLLIWQARQSAVSLAPAAGFEARPKEPAGKIEWPTAVRTFFEGPGG